MCLGVGTICTGVGEGQGRRQGPQPTISQGEAGHCHSPSTGTKGQTLAWPLSPNELGCPSELPPHPATGWGMREVGGEGMGRKEAGFP